jgi:ketosteroid isomerase-like protein
MDSLEMTLAQLQRTVDELSAREAIRDVLYRYARGVDRADVEVLKSCYHPDAVDAHWTFIGNGHEFAEEILRSHQMGQIPLLKHFITNILIELDGDRAFVESAFLCMLDLPLEEGAHAHLVTRGRYLDVFERRREQWKILSRLLVGEGAQWSTPLPVPGHPGRPTPDERQRASRFPDDPVYSRFDLPKVLPTPYRHEDDVWAPAREYFQRRLDAGTSGRDSEETIHG